MAALQVMLTNHYNSYFDLGIGSTFWGAFSGVPIFLLLTGFFIPMSYEHNSKTNQFLFNRVLKIIPEMWSSVLLGGGLMLIAGYALPVSLIAFLGYLLFYMFFPLYTPDYLRGYGVGALNGALWVIPVQFTFYLMVPFLYKVFHLSKNATLKIVTIFAVFVLINFIVKSVPWSLYSWGVYVSKIFESSIFVHFPMLFIGMLAYKNSDILLRIVKNRFLLFLVLHLSLYYTLVWLGMDHVCLASATSWTKWPLMLTLSLCIFSAGYTLPNLSSNILHGYDLSYALYVYHMPIANFVLFTVGTGVKAGILSTIAVLLVSIFSKRYIEDPFFKLKKNALRKI